MSSRALEDTGQVLALIVERSQPKSTKPPLSNPDVEARLRDLDVRSAQCYADMELKIHRFQKLARKIDRNDAVPSLALEDGDSLVHRLEDFRFNAEKASGGD